MVPPPFRQEIMPNIDKSQLRKIAKARRYEISQSDNDAANRLFSNFNFPISDNNIVSGFIPIGSEIDPRNLMGEIAKKGAKLCLPRINSETNNIDFHEYDLGDELEIGKMGLKEPFLNKKIIDPDIILVPLLAFDEKLYRLGYGGGYYDRAIAKLRQVKKIITIGIGFDVQKVDNIPVEPHDQKLDFILTEEKLYK